MREVPWAGQSLEAVSRIVPVGRDGVQRAGISLRQYADSGDLEYLRQDFFAAHKTYPDLHEHVALFWKFLEIILEIKDGLTL